MHGRLTMFEGTPAQADAAVDMAESEVLPILRGCDGYKGFTVGVDRESGKFFGLSFWSDAEALRASEAAVRASREQTAQTAGSTQPPDVRAYEIVIDDES